MISAALLRRVASPALRVTVARRSLATKVPLGAAVASTTSSGYSGSSSSSSSSVGLACSALLATIGVVTLADTKSPPAFALSGRVDWERDVRQDIVNLIENEDRRRGDGTGIGPTLVRLAWHASGTYDCKMKNGGSDGATMRFCPEGNWGANQGLCFARRLLEPIKAKYPGMTYADLWTFAGKVAVEEAGGPTIPWRAGRSDAIDGSKTVPDGRLPDASQGADHVRAVFSRMGFDDREAVALIGAHALGRCHRDNSGFVGPWTNAETTFSNEYFRVLLSENWTVKTTHEGKPYKGPLQYEDSSKKLMMLPTDMCLLSDAEYKKWVVAYKDDETLFFQDFASAFGKLMELGVPFPASGGASEGGIIASIKGALGL